MRWSLFFRIEWENLFTLSPMYQSRGKNRHSKSLQGLFFSRQVVFCLCSRRVDRSTLLRHFKYYYECFKIGAIQLELLFSGFVFVYLQGWLGWSPRTQKRQLLKQERGGGMNRRVTREKWKKKPKYNLRISGMPAIPRSSLFCFFGKWFGTKSISTEAEKKPTSNCHPRNSNWLFLDLWTRRIFWW